MRTDGLPRLLTIALVAGGLASSALFLSGSPHAQAPGASASAPAGMVPAADVPFYAEWAASPHARRDSEVFNHWNKEGSIPAVCARCHSTPGFLDYLGADASAAGKVDHPAPIGTVITCVACHNDKAVNLTSVTFPSGLKAEHQGNDARCMTCHQGVESTDSVNRVVSGLGDDQVDPKLDFVNVHYKAAGATLFGTMAKVGYEYPGKTYAGRLQHPQPYGRCLGCHQTHALTVKFNDCAACHREVTDKASLHKIRVTKDDRDGNGDVNEGVAHEIEHLREKLHAAILDYGRSVAGKPIVYAPDVYPYFFFDTNGDGKADKDEARYPNRYKAWTPRLLKGAYNYQFVTKDPGAYAHNPAYAVELLHDALNDLGTRVKVDLAKAKRP